MTSIWHLRDAVMNVQAGMEYYEDDLDTNLSEDN